MNPKHIKWYLGASSYAMILEQERRHWLMKTDKEKQVQDDITGDVFHGTIDNMGSDIVIETEKLYTKDIVVHEGTFSSENVSDVLSLASSVFSYIPMMNGLHFMRLKSINLMIETTYHNFRLVLKNVKTAYIPIAPDKNDPDQFVYKWYYTTTKPILQSMDNNGEWTIETEIEFSEGITNPIYYYPADEVLQPINASVSASDELVSDLITDPNMIGYPLLWFTCDESNIGPQIRMENNSVDDSGSLLLSIGHDGNVSSYNCKLFPVTGEADKSTPNGPTSDWAMVCRSIDDDFTGEITDALKPINRVLFRLKSGLPDDQMYVSLSDINGANRITLNMDAGWEYDSETRTYSVALDLFDSNLYGAEEPLIAAFIVQLDTSIPFDITTTDTGYVGIQMSSSKNNEEHLPRYPHEMTNLDGLPSWLRDGENMTPQHMAMYAIHNTPFYDPSDQATRQIAGLILDPGVERTFEDNFHPGKYRIRQVDIVNGGSGYNHHMGPNVFVSCYWDTTQGIVDPKLYTDDTMTTPIIPEFGIIYETQDEIDPMEHVKRRFYKDPATGDVLTVMPDELPNVYGNNRFWVQFADGSRSRTLFEITSVDENGTVTGVNPLYHDESSDDVRLTIYGYYNANKRKFYQDKTELIVIEPVENVIYHDIHENGKSYAYYGGTYHEMDAMIIGSAFDESYDPITLTGNTLTTVWNDSEKFTTEEILSVRNAQISGSNPTGSMDEENHPWWLYTYTTGIGLVLNITLEYIQEEEAPYTSDDVSTEEIGRVYVVSNDTPKYINNATAKHPKPERTAARICDIPTSVMQLSNISNLAPTMVVDKKYIRSEAPFTDADLDYLFNGSRNHWVRPTDLGSNGLPIYNPTDTENPGNSNKFVFDSWELLAKVDLMDHNDYRETTNLNAGVPPAKVSIATITTGGHDYLRGDKGVIVVGGYSFTYEVMEISPSGQVLDAEIGSNDDTTTLIALANFDLPEGYSSGITNEYGTSPIGDSAGRGLKVTLQIADYEDYIPKKRNIFKDIYAFVRDVGGIWIAEYNGIKWVKGVNDPIASASDSDVIINGHGVSYKDAYMKSIIPTAHTFTVSPEEKYGLDTQLMALQTASSINVIDQTHTPVWIPSTSSDIDPMDDKTWIDINKIYCRGMRTVTADIKNEASALDAIKQDGGCRYDSYIFWRWIQPSNASNRQLEYGIIHRSLDNLQSSDTTTFLPPNELETDKFVHTNAQTTIMWNVPYVGPMVWMYDPNSIIHEKYYVNAHTRDLYVVRSEYKWSDLEIIKSVGGSDKVVNLGSGPSGMLDYYIYSNNPTDSSVQENPDPIYKQPGFVKLAGPMSYPITELHKYHPIRGSWRLVFPSLTNAYKLQNIEDGREFTPVKMQILRGSNIGAAGDVLNDDDIPVNYKTLLMDENKDSGRVELKVYDQESHRWIQI